MFKSLTSVNEVPSKVCVFAVTAGKFPPKTNPAVAVPVPLAVDTAVGTPFGLAVQEEPAQPASAVSFYRLPAPALLALEQAATAGRIGETALIAAGLMQPVTLGWVAPQDSARVLAALQQAGLDDTATTLADELIRSYLLRHHFALDES